VQAPPTTAPSVALPDPGQARSLDELIERLRLLKVWAGNPSYDVIKDHINTAWHTAGRPISELTRKSTVADCFRAGRRRVNVDLVIAVVQALHDDAGYVAQWRQVLRVVQREIPAAAQVRVQDTLPERVAEFAGRGSELDYLRQVLRQDAGHAVVISAIEGMAGVGKTQLAIRAGQLLAEDEPFDHVLFVDLRGFHPDPSQPPADPAAVLDAFLRLLGVPAAQIPPELAARTAAYRHRLAGSRALVVLDNAANEEQIQPLLPDSAGCLTLVTSRRSLPALQLATHLTVDVLAPDEARHYLRHAVPDVPLGDDPDALTRVAQRCGHLPLALGLVAGHMRTKPDWTVTDHAEWLDERHRNQRLETGVELALSLSYQNLPADQRRLFRLLAIHPGHDIDIHSAAALAGTNLQAASDDLLKLSADHLLQQTTPYRFTFHDLVRAYAADRAADEDRLATRRAALTRLFDHYLSMTARLVDTLFEAEHRRPRVSLAGTGTPSAAEPAEARAWLDAERANLIAAAVYAASHGWPDTTTRLASTMSRYLDVGGPYGDAVTLHTHARHVARVANNRPAEAESLNNLAGSYWRQGHLHQAADYIEQALTLYRKLGDRAGEAKALNSLGLVWERLGRYPQAAEHHQQALDLFGELGDRAGEAKALNNLGHIWGRLGRYPQAAEHHQQALDLYRELGDRAGEAHALNHLGYVSGRLGHHQSTIGYHQQALTNYRELGHRAGESSALNNLGLAHQRTGDYRQAADHHRQARALYRELGNLAGETESLNGLGETLLADNQPDQARAQHTLAVALATDIGERYEEARAHHGLALSHHGGGNTDQARKHWHEALILYTELGLPQADEVRDHLTSLDEDPSAASTTCPSR